MSGATMINNLARHCFRGRAGGGGRGRGTVASGLAALWFAVGPGCLSKDDVKGLPCTENAHCGGLVDCVLGVCGGPELSWGENPCATGVNECADPNTLTQCTSGSPLDTDCALNCMSQGYTESFGCLVPPSTGRAQCLCKASSSACTDESGRTLCTESQRNLVKCQDSNTQYTDCDQYCRNLGLISQGCVDEGPPFDAQCGCVESVSCNPSESYCLNSQTVIMCDGGQWSELPCTGVLCPSGLSLGCDYSSGDDDFSCLCAN